MFTHAVMTPGFGMLDCTRDLIAGISDSEEASNLRNIAK
jgi:hypothetical protein